MSTPGPFEQWARSEGLISESHGVRFVNSQCDVAQKAWQASRTAALEEAAIAAWSAGMDEYGQYSQLMDPRHVGSVCAKRIRALAKGDGE